MDDNSGLGALATATPDVNTRESTPLDRIAQCENLGVAGVSSLKISEELQMICVRMVCSEPALAWNYDADQFLYAYKRKTRLITHQHIHPSVPLPSGQHRHPRSTPLKKLPTL